VRERESFFEELANDLIANEILPDKDIIFWSGRIPLLVRAYFIINESYKNWRMAEGHNTETPKIAALQCFAIKAISPFVPLRPQNVRTVAEARCNEIFALYAAAGILGVKIEDGKNIKSDLWIRFMDIISRVEAHSLEPLVVDVNMQIDRDDMEYVTDIDTSDRETLDVLITIFELLGNKLIKSNPRRKMKRS
jgi:hypothetical protein